MTGPEHYRTAEAILDYCANASMEDHDDRGRRVREYDNDGGKTEMIAAAQVHATLALAAAQARMAIAGSNSDSANEWRTAVHGAQT